MNVTIAGLAQLERALRQIQHVGAALGEAVAYATEHMQQGVQRRTHVLTGTLQSAQSYEVQGLLGSVFTAARRNPLSGATADTYGPIEEARGGPHAAYANAVQGDAPKVLEEAGEIIIRALP